MTGRTSGRDVILRLTDMTKSDSLSGDKFVITDAYRAIFALGNSSAFVADDAPSIAFFVDENSYLLALGQIFFYALTRQLRKIWRDLLGHINKKNFLNNYSLFIIHCSLFHSVIKAFIVHSIYVVKYKKYTNYNPKKNQRKYFAGLCSCFTTFYMRRKHGNLVFYFLRNVLVGCRKVWCHG